MTHKCNLCGKEMMPVDDINVRGFLIRGFRCECGNEHNGITATVCRSGDNFSLRLPKVITDLYRLDTGLKLPIKTSPGGIRIKIIKEKI